MNWTSIDQKYRPKSIGHIVGQKAVKAKLESMLMVEQLSNRLILLEGPTGVGKTTTARLIAAYLNCQNPKTENGYILEICGICQVCSKLNSANTHEGFKTPFHERSGLTNISDVTRLLGELQYKPHYKYGIFILDEAHCFSPDAQDVLLKPFENLPDRVVVILCTDRPEKLIEPLKGRCRRLYLKHPSQSEVKEHLIKVATSEGYLEVANNPKWIEPILESYDGSVREALIELKSVFERIDRDKRRSKKPKQ